MKQDEEDDQQQLIQEAHQRFERSRQARAKAEGRCLLGFVIWQIVGQAMQQESLIGSPPVADSSSPLPGDSSPATKEQ